MKNIYKALISLSILIACIFATNPSQGQVPVFTDSLLINQSFTSDTVVYPFNGQQLYGIAASGSVQFNSYSSWVRILVSDTNNNQFMVYETNPMLDTAWIFNFETRCEESCFLNGFMTQNVSFHINDATLTLGVLDYTQAPVDGADALQYQAKLNVDADKIARLNAFLEAKNMLWRAGETNFSAMYFDARTDEDEGLAKYPFGFEYYKGGIFQVYDAINEFSEPTYDVVERFDWRSRHGADIENTPYYDGDPNGSGWMTEVKCQKGCWFALTEEWECIIDEQDCLAAGGEPRGSQGCKGFSAIAVAEGFANLYYYQHVNFDLSEQQMISAPLAPPFDNCGDILNGGGGNGFSLIRDFGIIDELCFPFQGIDVPCSQQCPNPNNVVSIRDYDYQVAGTFDAEDLKKYVIANGPVAVWGIPPLGDNHAIALVGFDVVTLGDYFMIGNNTIVEIGPYDPQIGTPYWIFKNSYGPDAGSNGYYYIEVSASPTSVYNIDLAQANPITSTIYNQGDVQILDEDNDGYLNWGIGDCPSCPGERDGDDNNNSLGPVDENGFCRIINNYTTSFEGASYDYWKQDGNDDFDWILHSGPSTIPNTSPSGAWQGDRYMIIDGYEMDPGQGETSYFESPLIDLGSECLVSINFYYFRRFANGSACTLTLQLSWDEGETWSSAWSASNGDNDIEWHEVNLEFPASFNKIRFAGTMGSAVTQQNMGLDLISITPLSQTGPLVIEGEVSLNGEIHACDDIIIEPEAILKLESGCVLHMPEDHKIVVKRKAILYVDGATITNDGGGLWKGIEVWGNNQELNLPIIYQGWTSVYNGSIIENAECAFLASRINDATGDGLPEYSGGIVWVTNSSLINNKKAAWFLPYSGDDESFSQFKNCLIEVNDNIISGTTVEEFIELNGIDGVSFTDITMKDERANISILNRPCGIYATSSRFGVYGTNNSGTYTTTFNNLLYGIKVLGIQPTDYFAVKESAFYNNLRGIYTSATTGSQINFCYFQPWEYASGFVENYGLYLDECTGYQVEENLFENNSSTVYGNGLVINNSGTDANQVYRNTFTGLDYGIIAQNKNRHSNGLTGLCIKCNDFDDCNNDIVITTDVGDEDPELGISANQGANSANPEDMAGNLFYIEGVKSDGDFDDINNEANHITYYYPLNAPGFIERLKPVDYTQNSVTLIYETVTSNWTFENGCPTNFGGGGGGTGDGEGSEELLAKMAAADQKTDSIQTILNVLVDAGNTEELQENVYYSTPPETMQVYTEMINASPYLSDTVVGTAIQKEDVLPGAMVRDIMVANPHTAKSNILMDRLAQRWDPLPDYMLAQILQGRSITSLKEETESNLAGWKQKKARAFNALVNCYLSDTINSQSSITSLIELLGNTQSLDAKYMLAFTHLGQGAVTTGEDVLNSIPAQFALDAGQLTAHGKMTDYYVLLSAAQNGSQSILQADSTVLLDVWDIMDAQSGHASVFARNILLALGETAYAEPVILPDLYKSTEALEAYHKLLETEAPKYIRVKPNPAKDYIVIGYLLEKEGDILIEVSNFNGLVQYSNRATQNQDELTIDTRGWKPGLYIVSLMQNDKLIESTKFTLID
jgi:hypothetical protein